MKHHSLLVLLVLAILLLAVVPATADHGKHDPKPPPEGTPSVASDDDIRRIIGDEIIDTPVEMHKLHDQQHGPREGHLLPTQENVELVGQVAVSDATPGRIADVAAFGNYAYLAAFDDGTCRQGGVYVIDISDPTTPNEVGFIPTTAGSFVGEGVQILDMQTKFFQGQVLVFNNEICEPGGEGGVSLWDVTDPLNPVVLTAHAGDDDPPGVISRFHEIHSAFAWQDGKRAFVVLIDNEEELDVDILEITDPRNPVMIVETGLPDWPGAQDEQSEGMGTDPLSVFHDVQVKKVRGQMRMLLSYWDAGWVLVNVDDPANPVFIADSTHPDPDTLTEVSPPEGNAHQAEFSHNNQFILGTDEDFSPYRIDPFKITTGPNAGEYPAGEFGWTVPLASLPDKTLNGPTVYGGYGCPDDIDQIPPPPTGLALDEEAILVLQRGPEEDPNHNQHGPCFFSEKVEAAQNAGYGGVIITDHHVGAGAGDSPDAFVCGAPGHEFTPLIPAICIGHRAFHLLFNTTPDYTVPYPDADSPQYTEPALGAAGEKVSATPRFDGWGYVRLLDAQTLEQIGAYAITEALDPRFAFRFGDLSVHEVATDPNQNLAYLSYYAGGLRVIEFGEDGIQEVGRYIAEGGNNFWGVEVHRLPTEDHGTEVLGERGKAMLILASDRDSGLWIFRYTGK